MINPVDAIQISVVIFAISQSIYSVTRRKSLGVEYVPMVMLVWLSFNGNSGLSSGLNGFNAAVGY